jgi:hypothetical protein
VTSQWVRENVTCERVQITLVQLAAQAPIACKASEILVDGIFVPVNTPLITGMDGNVGEVTMCFERNIPLWDYNPSWQQMIFGARSTEA